MTVVSYCSMCCRDFELVNHLFFNCIFARKVWSWLFDQFQVQIRFGSILSVFVKLLLSQRMSSRLQDIRLAGVAATSLILKFPIFLGFSTGCLVGFQRLVKFQHAPCLIQLGILLKFLGLNVALLAFMRLFGILLYVGGSSVIPMGTLRLLLVLSLWCIV